MGKTLKQVDYSAHDGHRSRLRSRYAKGGVSALADYEFVELVLTFAIPRIDVKPIAKALLAKFKNLRGIIDAPQEELVKIKGVGETSALAIKMFADIITTYHLNELEEPDTQLGTIAKLIKYFKSKIASETKEVLELVCFDSQLKIIPDGNVRLFEGSVNSATVDIRKIIEIAIKKGASSIAIAHNHPSGNPTPSLQDIGFTRKLAESRKPISLNFIEHIIVGKNACFSFRRDGRFDDLYDESLMESRLRGACKVAEQQEKIAK
ncbi:MAG: DNA repair protein RadC [Opitutales bacterium]|nr:DNA repair protein RadC [Opitutales bacterium]